MDECECGGIGKRYFSYHNYVFDIPMDKLFLLTNNINLIEMSKSIKIRSGKLSNDIGSLNDLRGKLFLYFKTLLNQVKINCPKNGIRCEINRCSKKFILNNLPNYLTFNLQKAGVNSIMEILQTFILIPKIFDISTIFEHSSKQKLFYEFFGAVLLKQGSRNYACFFKNINYKWVHYDDEKITEFECWFDMISYCLQNGQTINILFYELQDKYADSEKELTFDDINLLERYCRSIDDISGIYINRFRQIEDLYPYESTTSNSITDDVRNSVSSTTVNNIANKHNTSKTSTSISTSKNNSNNNSNSRLDLLEYYCKFCNTRNRIENIACSSCHRNNELIIEDVLKRRTNIYNSSNNSSQVDEKLSSIKRQISNDVIVNPFTKAIEIDEGAINSKSNNIIKYRF